MPAKEGAIRFKVDSGADVTVIPKEELYKLGLDESNIQKTNKQLYGPSKQRIQCLGFVKTRFAWGDLAGEQIIYVCDGLKQALLKSENSRY